MKPTDVLIVNDYVSEISNCARLDVQADVSATSIDAKQWEILHGRSRVVVKMDRAIVNFNFDVIPLINQWTDVVQIGSGGEMYCTELTDGLAVRM